MADSTPTRKDQLRRRMRAILADSAGPAANVAGAVSAWLARRPELARVALFAALPGEPDLSSLPDRFADRAWCFPRVVDAVSLAFHRVRGIDALAAGAFGIPEPAAEAPRIAIDAIDAFLCPGLAFDRRGCRLGRGRGYYDRLLAAARQDALRVGVCFECQIVESTFPDPHDIPMDLVICESGVITPAD